jgi:hypothetical protein
LSQFVCYLLMLLTMLLSWGLMVILILIWAAYWLIKMHIIP